MPPENLQKYKTIWAKKLGGLGDRGSGRDGGLWVGWLGSIMSKKCMNVHYFIGIHVWSQAKGALHIDPPPCGFVGLGGHAKKIRVPGNSEKLWYPKEKKTDIWIKSRVSRNSEKALIRKRRTHPKKLREPGKAENHDLSKKTGHPKNWPHIQNHINAHIPRHKVHTFVVM